MRDKAVVRRSIGPVWDGNEVWLLTAGGALFAAFPPAYATTFSGFYLAVMLVLFGLIVRAVSVEFRGHDPQVGAHVGRLLLRGVALAGAAVWAWPWATSMRAFPWMRRGDYIGLPLIGLITPFTLLTGLLGPGHVPGGTAPRGLPSRLRSPLNCRRVRPRLRLPLQVVALVLFAVGVAVWALRHPAGHGPGLGRAALGVRPGVRGGHRGLPGAGEEEGLRQGRVRCPVRFGAWLLVGLLATSMFPNLVVASAGQHRAEHHAHERGVVRARRSCG